MSTFPAEIGLVAVLHTWGQTLDHHPHVHCIVPGGGLSPDRRRWIACRPGFFLPVRVLSKLFRRLFLAHLDAAFKAGRLRFSGALSALTDPASFVQRLDGLRSIDWVVYAKPPFGSPEQVLAYLSRYTHRVAIANSRLITLKDGRVSFRWHDYRHNARNKIMTLAAEEFIRRFLLHTLPDGLQRIRHYGFLANGQRTGKLALCRQLLAAPPSEPPPPPRDFRERFRQLTGRDLDTCPCCGGHMVPLGPLPRTPPQGATAFRCDTYIGAGAAIFWPSGHPTGGTTSFLGSATAPAVRIGWGMDHQFDQFWSAGFKVGIQHTGNAEFETTSEPFRFDHKNEVIFGLNLTYTPAGN